MSNLTDLLPAGAGGKQVDFVASGTLSSGQTVVLKTDGTVEAVSGNPQVIGTATVFESANSSRMSATFDSNSNKVVIAYADNANSTKGTAVVGTVSGTSISFGGNVIFESGIANEISITFDSSQNKVVIVYINQMTGNGLAKVGTVSGTSISFGSAYTLRSSLGIYKTSATFDSNSNKVIAVYQDGSTNYGVARVGTISGTSISFGSTTIFNTGTSTTDNSATFDSNSNKVVIAYRFSGTPLSGRAVVGTVSGTSISFGSAVTFNSATADYISAAFDSSLNKVVIAYRDYGNSYYATAIVGTVSGTSISFGSAVVFKSDYIAYTSATFDSSANKTVIAYQDNGNSGYGTAIVGTVSGTSISFGSEFVFQAASSQYTSAIFDSNSSKVVVAYRDGGNDLYGTGIVFQNESSNNTDFIGITDAAISDTASGSVTIKGGISTNVTGLTPNQNYYVQVDGTLSTTASDVLAGKALSSTSINLDYTT